MLGAILDFHKGVLQVLGVFNVLHVDSKQALESSLVVTDAVEYLVIFGDSKIFRRVVPFLPAVSKALVPSTLISRTTVRVSCGEATRIWKSPVLPS